MKLSEHFTLSEFTFSQTAVRRGIDNTPNKDVVKNLTALCELILEPLRAAAGKPIRISSGYRSPALNKAVKGSATSQHCFGEAVDLSCPGLSITELTKILHSLNLPVDQVIHEGTWLHISHKRKGGNRGQWLKATFTNGRAKYSQLDLL